MTGGPDPPEKSQNIGFPSNIDPDPLKITKLPSQHSMVGHYRHANETPFQWRFEMVFCCRADDGPLLVKFRFSPSHQIKKQNKTKQKKHIVSKTFWIRAWSSTHYAVLLSRRLSSYQRLTIAVSNTCSSVLLMLYQLPASFYQYIIKYVVLYANILHLLNIIYQHLTFAVYTPVSYHCCIKCQ